MSQLVAQEERPLPPQPLFSPRLPKNLRRAMLYGLLLIAVFWSVFPLFLVFISSIKPDIETYAPEQTIFPKHPTLSNYLTLFKVTEFTL